MSYCGNLEYVKTISAATIPPWSEAILQVKCTNRPVTGEYMIEGHPNAVTQPLLIERTLINTRIFTHPCRIMNVTEKEVKLKPKTTVGFLSPVTIENSTQQKITSKTKTRIPHEEQLNAVTDKGISLKDCAMTGSDFHAFCRIVIR